MEGIRLHPALTQSSKRRTLERIEMGYKCYMIEPVFSETEKDSRGNPKVIKYQRSDTGEEHEFPHQFSPGAMFYCPWIENRIKRNKPDDPFKGDYHLGNDGRVLAVITPGGQWIIDSRCSNCGSPNDNEHHCWVRHGGPPNITVDKNGLTCSAGAGSIQCGHYHGFLKNGELTA
jgi:hypothetical protein